MLRRAEIAGALAAVALTGCFRAHERDGAPPLDASFDAAADARAPSDAGTDAARDGGRDARIDAGSDAGLCTGVFEELVLHLCVFEPTGALPAGQPGTIALSFASCACMSRGCSMSIGDRMITLDTHSCPDLEECDDCSNELACEIPPLEAGDWTVRLDGFVVATIPVRPRMPVTVARPTCWAIPDEATTPRTCDRPGDRELRAPMLCYRALEDVGTFVRFEVTEACAGCSDIAAECAAQLDGRMIRLRPAMLRCDCATDECAAQTIRCTSPPLRDGDYQVVLEGTEVRGTLQVRDVLMAGPTVCVP